MRNRRVAQLEAELLRAQAGELADIARRRAEMEAQIDADRRAIQDAQRRLEELIRLQGGTPPPVTPPPPPPPPPSAQPPAASHLPSL
jgi:hypothetical protein